MYHTRAPPLRPASPPTAQSKFKAWGYPFDYIHPAAHPEEMRKLVPEASGPVSDIPGTGPAPILMRAADWAKVRSGRALCCAMLC